MATSCRTCKEEALEGCRPVDRACDCAFGTCGLSCAACLGTAALLDLAVGLAAGFAAGGFVVSLPRALLTAAPNRPMVEDLWGVVLVAPDAEKPHESQVEHVPPESQQEA